MPSSTLVPAPCLAQALPQELDKNTHARREVPAMRIERMQRRGRHGVPGQDAMQPACCDVVADVPDRLQRNADTMQRPGMSCSAIVRDQRAGDPHPESVVALEAPFGPWLVVNQNAHVAAGLA